MYPTYFIVQRQRSIIPCYWESQPTGCLKTHCPFKHTKPQPKIPDVRDRISEYKLSTIKVKSLSELRSSDHTSALKKNAPAPMIRKLGSLHPASSFEDTRSDDSMFKLERVIEEASLQARGIRNVKPVPQRLSADIKQIKKPQNGYPEPLAISRKDSLSIFSPKQLSSSESIFSPKYNPILSRKMAAEKNTRESLFNGDYATKKISTSNKSTTINGSLNQESTQAVTKAKYHPSHADQSDLITTKKLVSNKSLSVVPTNKVIRLKRSSTLNHKGLPEPKKVHMYTQYEMHCGRSSLF